MTNDPRAGLVALLGPILDALAGDDVRDMLASESGARALGDRLSAAWPITSPTIVAIEAALHSGLAAGWLCDRGEAHARFSRLAKPSAATRDHSLDVVCLEGAALEHAHPGGEITLALPLSPADADARFDGHPPGWIVLPAGSRHVPTVTGGRLILLYALPGGAVEWN